MENRAEREHRAVLTAVARYLQQPDVRQKDIPAKIQEDFPDFDLRHFNEVSVTRLKQEAEREHIIKSYVCPPPLLEMQAELTNKLAHTGIHRVFVVPRGVGKNEENLGGIGAEQLRAAIQRVHNSEVRITFACGGTLRTLAKSFFSILEPRYEKELKRKFFEFFPAFLADDSSFEHVYPHTLLAYFGTRLQEIIDPYGIDGRVKAKLLTLPPGFYSLNEDKRNYIIEEFKIREVIEESKNSDIFLVGIGSIKDNINQGMTPYYRMLTRLDTSLCNKLHKYKAESHFIPIDSNGEEHKEIVEKILAVTINDLRDIMKKPNKTIIAVAGGDNKKEAIMDAMANPYFNIFITDDPVADYLLRNI